jgi:drug/metabolite transporter (DMT)-like permease
MSSLIRHQMRERLASTAASSQPISTAAFLCLLAGGCAIGFAPIFVRLAETGPVASAFWRMVLAAPLLWAWAWHVRGSEPQTRAPYGAIIGSGLFFAGDLGVWHWSIMYTSVANSALLVNLAPVFVTLAGWLLWRRTVTRTFVVAMIIAIFGMLVLVGPNFAVGGTKLLGDALGVVAAVSYAGYLLSVKAARDAKASIAKLMACSTTITAVVLLPIALLSPQSFLPHSAHGWWVLVALALVTQILGQGFIAYALAHLPASLSSLSLLIQPVTAVIFAWAIFGEAIGALQFAGGTIVLTGIWLARKGSQVPAERRGLTYP